MAASPVPIDSSHAIDAANRISVRNVQALIYDANGNLTNDSVNSYTWNARN